MKNLLITILVALIVATTTHAQPIVQLPEKQVIKTQSTEVMLVFHDYKPYPGDSITLYVDSVKTPFDFYPDLRNGKDFKQFSIIVPLSKVKSITEIKISVFLKKPRQQGPFSRYVLFRSSFRGVDFEKNIYCDIKTKGFSFYFWNPKKEKT